MNTHSMQTVGSGRHDRVSIQFRQLLLHCIHRLSSSCRSGAGREEETEEEAERRRQKSRKEAESAVWMDTLPS